MGLMSIEEIKEIAENFNLDVTVVRDRLHRTAIIVTPSPHVTPNIEKFRKEIYRLNHVMASIYIGVEI